MPPFFARVQMVFDALLRGVHDFETGLRVPSRIAVARGVLVLIAMVFVMTLFVNSIDAVMLFLIAIRTARLPSL